ncbi:MAG TPA: A/G-specific adenine glycosylase, partial [Gemmatimonadetes bacterium]|nr:A/G-specific adenine glycosylase [Gemmatimonadota bacterium]
MRFHRALLAHYDQAARDLPWRRDKDPYRILVSEFMLQQTRVETVVRYYEPWLERFPSLLALAEANEDEVLKAWEGLGYYRRARNLHQAARIIVESHSGSVPMDMEELRALPGVGEYTTGAVASIAFDIPTPAVDGNVRRVLARFFDEERPGPAWLRGVARETL